MLWQLLRAPAAASGIRASNRPLNWTAVLTGEGEYYFQVSEINSGCLKVYKDANRDLQRNFKNLNPFEISFVRGRQAVKVIQIKVQQMPTFRSMQLPDLKAGLKAGLGLKSVHV